MERVAEKFRTLEFVDELARLRPGSTPGWMPSVADGADFLTRRARPGDVAITIGAGDVDRAGPLLLEHLGGPAR